MKKKWSLSVKGKGHQLVVDGSTTGEDVIRIDGRVAARALDPDETQRAFFVDGVERPASIAALDLAGFGVWSCPAWP